MSITLRLLSVSALMTASTAAPASPLTDELSAAAKAYYQGQIDSSVQTLMRIADRETVGTPSLDGKLALEYLLDTCVGALDFPCLTEYWPKYSKLVASLPGIPDPLKLPFALQTSYYSGVATWLSGNPSFAEAWLKAWPETIPEAPYVPRDYIRRQLVRAKLYLILGQRENARLCVDRALMEIASIENAGSSLRELSVWLVDAIELLLATGDFERATGLMFTNAAVGQNVFPQQSIEFYHLLRVGEAIYVNAGTIQQARTLSERALAVLSQLKPNANVKKFLDADARTSAALICLFADDLACARRHLSEHPLHADLDSIRARGVLQSYPEATYFALRALVDAAPGGDPPTREDLALLTTPMNLQAGLSSELRAQLLVYQRMAHAIAIRHADVEVSQAELRALSPELLRSELGTTNAIGFLPKRTLLDRLLLSLALNGFRGYDLDVQSADTAVRLLEVLARNGQTYSSEALALLRAARTAETRDDIRDLLRLRSRRDSAERVDIGRVLSAKPNLDPTGKVVQPTIDFRRRSVYSDYGMLIRQVSARLRAVQPDLTSADAPPTLAQIQNALREHEVVIATPVMLGSTLAHLCIRRDSVTFSTSTEDAAALVRDIKLLEASLTSGNAPSVELDRQYPVTAARHLYDALLKPDEGCFHPGDAIVWVGLQAGTVPPAALLTRGTSSELEGKRLADWPWLVKETSVSRVETLSTLVALRRALAPSVAVRPTQFLGVGDPLFAGSPESAQNVAQVALRGAVGAEGLSALPQLPDTRAEIVSTSDLFPDRKTLLLGPGATEGDLRRLPLERFAYLAFATHGLIRQDISGLTEPALALTPVSSTDSFNDGLLTASEIADLPLKARFVALSACNTGALDFTKFASEVPSLSAAFQVAGVPAILATMWPVESEASRRIVQETFKGLVTERIGPAAALAHAQLHYLASAPSSAYEHPRFWAPFVIFGDGTTPSEAYSEPAAVQLGTIRLLTTSGGEVSSLIQGDSGSLFLQGIGDVRHGIRHASLAMKLRTDLSPQWVREDPEIANGHLALRLEGGVLFGGYRGGGDTVVSTILDFVDVAGHLQQRWEYAPSNADFSPVGALRLGPRAALIAVLQHARQAASNATSPSDHLLVVELKVGQPLSKVLSDFTLTSHVAPSHVGLQWLGNDILVVVTDQPGQSQPKPFQDDFHQLKPCNLVRQTSLTLVRRSSWTRIWEKELPDVEIRQVLPGHKGAVWLAGSANAACGEGTRMGLWTVTEEREVKNLFLDQALDAQTLGLFERPNGSLLLLGVTNRATDVDSYQERDTQTLLARLTSKNRTGSVSFSTRRINNGVLILLDPALKVASRQTLRAASDLWLEGAFSIDGHTWLYGSLGNQGALMQLVEF